MRYPCIRVDIYERDQYPVVSHIFYGKTLKEANEYFQAHMKTDVFLRSAILYQKYQGILLHVDVTHG